MTYVYQHRRLDTGKVFYIGIGIEGRSTSTKSRNPYWRNIVRKTSVVVEIIDCFENREDACDLERQLISLYKRFFEGGSLCNIMEGGEGGGVPTKYRKVLQFDKKGNFLKEYESSAEADRQTTGRISDIHQVCKGNRKTSGGYIWKYK